MGSASDILEEEPLHVAGTRPALMAGIPMELAVVLTTAFFAIDVAAHSMLWGFAFAPFWFLGAVLVRHDYNGVRIFFIWLRSSALMLDAHLWGGASVSPLPVRLPRRPREIPDAV